MTSEEFGMAVMKGCITLQVGGATTGIVGATVDHFFSTPAGIVSGVITGLIVTVYVWMGLRD